MSDIDYSYDEGFVRPEPKYDDKVYRDKPQEKRRDKQKVLMTHKRHHGFDGVRVDANGFPLKKSGKTTHRRPSKIHKLEKGTSRSHSRLIQDDDMDNDQAYVS